MRTFIRMRELLATHKELAEKLLTHDQQIAYLFEEFEKLRSPTDTKKHPIGYVPEKDKE